ICDGGELGDLVAQNDDPARIGVFFVDRFRCSTLGGAVDGATGIGGIAPGIPGAPFVASSPLSGIAMRALDASTDTGAGTAFIVAHELGHLLGLSHNVEQVATETDHIDDTPDGADPDAQDNLMYWQSNGPVISAGQSDVLR